MCCCCCYCYYISLGCGLKQNMPCEDITLDYVKLYEFSDNLLQINCISLGEQFMRLQYNMLAYSSGSLFAELCVQWLPWEKCSHNDADWQPSLNLMRSRFLPLLTPVVFTARLSSGRQRRGSRREQRSREGLSEFTTLWFLRQTQPASRAFFALLHDMLYWSWNNRLCWSHSNEKDFHWHVVDEQELVSGTLEQTF